MSQPFDTFEGADARLKGWVSEIVGAVPVSLDPPASPSGSSGSSGSSVVGLYLLDLTAAPPPRGAGDAPLRVAPRYLVTTWADEPSEAHRLLGELLFAAQDTPWLEVELGEFPPTLWSAFGTAPRPSFVLRVYVQRERETRPVKLVLRHVVKHAAATALEGRVLGPGDLPIPDATVTLPSLALTSRTDGAGRFRFAAVPPDPPRQRLQVKAKGVVLVVDVDVPGGGDPADEPLTIRVPITEG